MSKYRRVRRTRMGKNRNNVVNQLVSIARRSTKVMTNLENGNRNKAFGYLLTHWLDETRESVIDRYVDEEAKDVTGYALNIIAKQLREQEEKSVSPAKVMITFNL